MNNRDIICLGTSHTGVVESAIIRRDLAKGIYNITYVLSDGNTVDSINIYNTLREAREHLRKVREGGRIAFTGSEVVSYVPMGNVDAVFLKNAH